MGISGILRWTNPPLANPNGLDIVLQRISEQYGQNVVRKPYQVRIRQHRPNQGIPQLAPPGSNSDPTALSRSPSNIPNPAESLITVIFPRASATSRPVAYVQQTRHQKARQTGMSPAAESGMQGDSAIGDDVDVVGRKPDEMLTKNAGDLVTWLQEQGAKGNKYLAYPKINLDPAGKNVANMTASLLGLAKKVRTADPYADPSILPPPPGNASAANITRPPIPTVSGGSLTIVDGFQLEINLGGVGMDTAVEWVVRVGWVTGMGGENARGLIIGAEYMPIDGVPLVPLSAAIGKRPRSPDIPIILQEFLLSLLPDPRPSSVPPTYKLTSVPSDEAWSSSSNLSETWTGPERLRRVAWMLISGLREDGVLI